MATPCWSSCVATPADRPGAGVRQTLGVDIPRARFERLVSDALDTIPEEFERSMENVAVIVEDWPSA